MLREHWPASVESTKLLEQVSVGSCVSCTVTVKEQFALVALVQFTVVVPTGKNEPEAGVQVTVPQGPLVVGGA